MFPFSLQTTFQDPAFSGPSRAIVDGGHNRLIVVNTRANQLLWTDLAANPPVWTAVGMFGMAPQAEGFSLPSDVVADAAGNLIVLDSGNGELDHYTFAAARPYGYDSGFLGGQRHRFAQFALLRPAALQLNGQTLYILDTGNHRVVSLDLVTSAAGEAVQDLSWNGASGLAVAADGSIFVSDTQQHRILKYVVGQAAEVIGSFGAQTGQFRLPRGLAIDANQNLYVADSGNQRVQVMDLAGVPLAVIGSAAVFISISGVALDAAGDLYVADSGANAVLRFGPTAGGPLLHLGSSTLSFGTVGVGYSLDRPLLVRNDGAQPLNVTGVSSNNTLFAPAQASFQVAARGSQSLVVRF
jgi:sugar lactone lactonase YvrE